MTFAYIFGEAFYGFVPLLVTEPGFVLLAH